jgi:formate/nitrite transporter FocA (FNT family)
MDYVLPAEIVSDAVRAAEKKAGLSARDLMIRGTLSGVFLGYATSLAMVAVSQGLPPIVWALIFPVGFLMLVLLGLELATGNFALLPMAWMEGRIGMGALFTGVALWWTHARKQQEPSLETNAAMAVVTANVRAR